MKNKDKYTVIRDSREQKNYWTFEENNVCAGTIVEKLNTGDYSISGLENIFSLERKYSSGELAKNITEKRFERELERMDKFEHSFLVLEFTLEDVLQFPFGSTIPRSRWKDLKVSSNFILKRILEIETSHKVKIIFAGKNGKLIAERIFSRIIEIYK